MEVEQKRVTIIRLHDAKGCDIRLTKEGTEFQLQLSSGANEVNITLGHDDIRSLCHQLVQMDLEENWKAHYVAPPEFRSFFFNGAHHRQTHEPVSSWFSKAAEAADRAGKRN